MSTKHLAPCGESLDPSVPQVSPQPLEIACDTQPQTENSTRPELDSTESGQIPTPSTEPQQAPTPQNVPDQGVPLRRSTRIRRPRVLSTTFYSYPPFQDSLEGGE